ncbi:hypothetical protein D3C77_215840 [compost metagenome]
MNQMSASVAVFFFKARENLVSHGVAGADDVHAVRARFAECTMNACPETNSGLSHSDNQYRAWQVGGDLCCQRLVGVLHHRRFDRNMLTQHPRNKQKCPLRVAAFCKPKQRFG